MNLRKIFGLSKDQQVKPTQTFAEKWRVRELLAEQELKELKTRTASLEKYLGLRYYSGKKYTPHHRHDRLAKK